MANQNSIVALIPARSGSKRIPNKNIRPLNGVPLLAYTIHAAKESGIFGAIVVSTDEGYFDRLQTDPQFDAAALIIKRPTEYAADNSPDVEWVNHAIGHLRGLDCNYDAFSILRPTSPFRTADTIRRAWAEFQAKGDRFDSLRAVDAKPKQHPWKMWMPVGEGMMPLFVSRTEGQPSHSVPTQLLPQVWPQNASLEIAWTSVLERWGTISGERVMQFFTDGYEGYDMNTEDDWLFAEWLVETGRAALPQIESGHGSIETHIRRAAPKPRGRPKRKR